jgi:hypothetical protein
VGLERCGVKYFTFMIRDWRGCVLFFGEQVICGGME